MVLIALSSGLSVVLLLSVLAGVAAGRETSFWVTETDSDFRSGTAEHVSIRRPGVVSLAPELDTLLASDENYFWCLARGPKGALYAGSGDSGRVYALNPDGSSSVLMEGEDLEVLCLAADRKGNLYAGTAPGGLIHKMTPGGESTVFFDTGESYVWCLVFDGKGNLYAGTGDGGKVYRISPDGKGEVFYETGERHVMCALYRDGELVIGTEGTGLVISLSDSGVASVMYDCDEQEVRDLEPGSGGVVYAAAVERTSSLAGPRFGPGDGGDVDGERKQASGVYRINADNTATKMWASKRTTVYSLWVAGEDSLFLGTGDEGRIYCLSQKHLELVESVEDSQILDIVGDGDKFFFCTGNGANVFSGGPGVSEEGTLTSKVFDTANVSRWGTLWWDADVPSGASLRVQTRSGNCETPDKTWSEWSGPHASPGRVPDTRVGRFVQWKALLAASGAGRSPSLTKVSLAYTGKNLPPSIANVRVVPQGIPFSTGAMEKMPERVSQTLPGGIKVEYSVVSERAEPAVEEAAWARTIRTVIWEASDPNGDKLTFSVYCRGIKERRWRLLGKDVEGAVFAWNTSAYTDGSYLVRVVASDSPDNTAGESLTGEALSPPFEVDNTPPRVQELRRVSQAGGVRIAGSLSDEMSAVVDLEYSVNGNEWLKLQSSDGLLDSRGEEFSFLLEDLDEGEHTVMVRATDSAGNVGVGSITVER